jgi:hypothetical protein
MTEGKEVRDMQHDIYGIQVARDLRADDIRSARLAAHVDEARAMRARGESAPIRRALGRSLIRLGERIAAEQVLRPARSP